MSPYRFTDTISISSSHLAIPSSCSSCVEASSEHYSSSRTLADGTSDTPDYLPNLVGLEKRGDGSIAHVCIMIIRCSIVSRLGASTRAAGPTLLVAYAGSISAAQGSNSSSTSLDRWAEYCGIFVGAVFRRQAAWSVARTRRICHKPRQNSIRDFIDRTQRQAILES